MKYKELKDQNGCLIKGPLLISPNVYEDERGYFYESWNSSSFNKLLGKEIEFKQDNESFSSKGVLRGMHFQIKPKAQGKLIRVISGSIFDVVVDLRQESPTFRNWAGLILDQDNKFQLWVPEGFAHGFLAVSNDTRVLYKTTSFWDKNLEQSLNWNDKDINIDWPFKKFNINNPNLSKKDNQAPTIIDLIKLNVLF